MTPGRSPVTGSSREAVLAIDCGLTAVKAAWIDRTGACLGIARIPWRGYRSLMEPGSGARDPWPFLVAAVRALLARSGAVTVRALVASVAAQSGVCLDDQGGFLSLPVAARWGEDPPDPIDAAVAADPAWGPDGMVRYGYAGVLARTLARARVEQPAVWGRIVRAGPLHAYVLDRLTGRWATDYASGPDADAWPAAVARASGLSERAFPELLAGEATAGALSLQAAEALGLTAGIPVVTGGHDGVCSSLGAGAYRRGDMAVTLSTNFVPRPVTGERIPGLFGYTIRPGAWAWVQGLPLCGTQLDLARRVLWPGATWEEVERCLEEEGVTQRGEEDAGDPEAFPYLPPAAVKHQVRRLADAVRRGTPRAHLWLRVHEGLVAALVQRIAEGAARGAVAQRVVVTGGASQDALFVSLFERALGMPVERAHPEAGLWGAASLAAASIGWAASPEDALCAWRSLAGTRRGGT